VLPGGVARDDVLPGGVARADVLPGGVARDVLPGVLARADVLPGAAPLPLVTTGTAAEPLAPPAAPGRFASAEPSLSAVGSTGGGAMPGARVNFGGDDGSAGRLASCSPFAAALSFFAVSPGVAEDPGPPDFACVSGIN
jgi:hypothetical protein